MQRVRDIAPQPPSANQLARLDRQLQDKLLQQHVLQPASPASALVSAERHDAAVRNLRIRNAAELAGMQTEIDALVEEQQRLCRLEESLLGHSGPSEAASSTESSRSTDSHIVTAREHARRLQLLTGLIQQRLVDRAEIDQLAAAIVAARSAAARARKLESYRETANRPAAQQREISIQRSVEALERERAEIARLEDAIAEHRRAHVAHQRECALVERRAAEVAVRVAEKSDAFNALSDAVSYARSRADNAYLDGVAAGFQRIDMSAASAQTFSKPLPEMRSSQSARTLSTAPRPSSAISHRHHVASGASGNQHSPDASNGRLNAETKRQQVVTAYCRPASALVGSISGSVSASNLFDSSLHGAHRVNLDHSATNRGGDQQPDDDDGDDDQRAVDRLLARAECDSLAAFFTPFVDAPRADVVVSMLQRLDVLEAHASRGGRFDNRLLPDLVQMLVDALEPNLPVAPTMARAALRVSNRAGAAGARARANARGATADAAGRYSAAEDRNPPSRASAGGARRK